MNSSNNRKKIILFASNIAAICNHNKYKKPWEIFEYMFKKFEYGKHYNKIKQNKNLQIKLECDEFDNMIKDVKCENELKELENNIKDSNNVEDKHTLSFQKILNKASLILPKKDQKKFNDHLKSYKNKTFGTHKETKSIQKIEKILNCSITGNNSKFYMKYLGHDDQYDYYYGGKVDGFTDKEIDGFSKKKVIEIKNRTSLRIMNKHNPPLYDIIQLYTYMKLTNKQEGLLIEHYQSNNSKDQIKISVYPTTDRLNKLWNTIEIDMIKFAKCFSKFISNKNLQLQFFKLKSKKEKHQFFTKHLNNCN
jgi:hypothetical protein